MSLRKERQRREDEEEQNKGMRTFMRKEISVRAAAIDYFSN